MRRKRDGDLVVAVLPIGVVVCALGLKGYLCHEGEGLAEGFEAELAHERRASGILVPFFELCGQGRGQGRKKRQAKKRKEASADVLLPLSANRAC